MLSLLSHTGEALHEITTHQYGHSYRPETPSDGQLAQVQMNTSADMYSAHM